MVYGSEKKFVQTSKGSRSSDTASNLSSLPSISSDSCTGVSCSSRESFRQSFDNYRELQDDSSEASGKEDVDAAELYALSD